MSVVTHTDLRWAADVAVAALSPHADGDWSRTAGTLDWSCRQTLDHVVDALVWYSTHLATRAQHRVPAVRGGEPDADIPRLLGSIRSGAAILAELTVAADPGVRAFHPAGMADAEGFLAMGCDEILVHTYDIAAGLEVDFAPPGELCASVLTRLFPWAPGRHRSWDTLLWANGRQPLGDRAQLDPDWHWHCAPLDEWDGTVARRAAAAD